LVVPARRARRRVPRADRAATAARRRGSTSRRPARVTATITTAHPPYCVLFC